MPFAALLARPIVIVSLLLMASLAGNYALYRAWQGEVRRSGALAGERDQALAAGRECTRATEALQAQMASREKKLKAALAAANAQARAATARAETTLQAAPSVPGDMCASALDLSRRKLAERQKAVPR